MVRCMARAVVVLRSTNRTNGNSIITAIITAVRTAVIIAVIKAFITAGIIELIPAVMIVVMAYLRAMVDPEPDLCGTVC